MDRSWYMRAVVVLGVCGLAIYMLYPSYHFYYEATAEQREKHDAFCDALPTWAPCKKFNLGLDLQGGLHLVMGVQVDKAVEHRVDRLGDALRDGLKDDKLAFQSVERPRDTVDIVVKLAEGTDMAAVEKFVRRDFSVLDVTSRQGRVLTLNLIAEEIDRVRENTLEQAIKTIRNRVDELGVAEPTIAKRGSENILIQLPGVKDPSRAIDIIGRTAQLEFKIADEEATAVFDEISASDLPEGVTKEESKYAGPGGKQVRDVYFELPVDKKDAVRALLEQKIPSNREIAFGETQVGRKTVKDRLRTYVLTAKAGITGDYLTDAQVQQNNDIPSRYDVVFSFDAKGGKIFGELTGANIKRHLAIVLDDTVNSAPVINSKIMGNGVIELTGGGTAADNFEEAKTLSLVLRAGALPAPVEIREQRQVGESLGAVSIQNGRKAIMVGGILVILFMALYYRLSGLIANLALCLNVVLVLAVLAMFEATLTLPGMAGIVLTIGMAVDANVIIFERIREELRVGKTPRAAIESGYAKAFSTIMDANVTTLIAGIVLMEYGSGPIRGFAVTLIVGILSSMFTAIIVTRLVFDSFAGRRRLQSLSI